MITGSPGSRGDVLPQKLLVLHQFRPRYAPGAWSGWAATSWRSSCTPTARAGRATRTPRGGGSTPAAGELWWGWKNFYDEDPPMITPGQTVADVHPLPQLISYQ